MQDLALLAERCHYGYRYYGIGKKEEYGRDQRPSIRSVVATMHLEAQVLVMYAKGTVTADCRMLKVPRWIYHICRVPSSIVEKTVDTMSLSKIVLLAY